MNAFVKVVGAVMALSVTVPVCAFGQSAEAAHVAMATEETDWVSVNLESAGSLGVEVLYKVDKLSDVQNIRVSGPLNDADWTTLKNMTSVVNIDLSGASATGIPNGNFMNRSSLKTILLPDGLNTIGSECFSATGLVEIVIPKSVISIGESCFYGCKSLVSAEVNGVSSLPYRCFYNCTGLNKVVIAEGLQSIGTNCFEYDASLAVVNLPSTLISIGSYAFGNCKALTEIVFPESLTSMEHNCFERCGLVKAILPEQLAFIGDNAFYDSQSMTEIVLPAKVYAYSNQFSNCRNITSITCRTATPPAIRSGYDPFSGCTKSSVTLRVPDFSLVNYKLDTYWLGFGNIEGGVEGEFWALNSDLALTNNRRMEGTPSLDILTGGSLTVSGSAPMPVNHLDIRENLYYNQRAFGQLLNSSPAMTANSATLYYYCERDRWYFITMPCDVKLSGVTHSAGGSFVFRYYDGEARAANGTGGSWKDVPADGVMEAGKAYIYQSDRTGDIVMNLDADGIQGLLAAGHRTVTVNAWASENAANAGWNLVGNPLLTYFDMASTSLTCPVTTWDDYNRRYVAYSLIDDDVVLYPSQAFFMQQIGENADITFDAKGRQLTSEVARVSGVAPAPGVAGRRALFNLVLSCEGETEFDRTRVVLNDDASMGYESACDASKFFADGGDVAEIFTIDAEGNRLAINERPEGDGKVRIGVYAPAAGHMTISASRIDGDAELYDSLTGTRTVLGKGKCYTFTAAARGFITDRFSITVRKPTSGIESPVADSPVKVTVDGNTVTVNGAEGLDVAVYTLDGRKVASAENAEAGNNTFILASGVYIVKAGNSTVKCYVK